DRAQQYVQPGGFVAAVTKRVCLCGDLRRHLRDDGQRKRGDEGGKTDRDERPTIAQNLRQFFSEDDQHASHARRSTTPRNASSRSRWAPLTSAVEPLATTRPSCRIVTRSHSRSASCSTCVEKMTHFPRTFDSTMKSRISLEARTSRLDVGSSNISTSGACNMARALRGRARWRARSRPSASDPTKGSRRAAVRTTTCPTGR